MFRKLALAAVGALTLGAGVASAPAPAAAQFGFHFGHGGHHWHHHHRPHFGFGVYPRYRYYDHYRPRHCERVVIRKKVGKRKWWRIVERRCYRPYRYW